MLIKESWTSLGGSRCSVFDLTQFKVIVLLTGRYDLRRSREWFRLSLEEFISLVRKMQPEIVLLLCASLPSVTDTKKMIGEMIARNALLQDRCKLVRNRVLFEYSRPGKCLLAKGGPVPYYYSNDAKLSKLGVLKLSVALSVKFISASLASRASLCT